MNRHSEAEELNREIEACLADENEGASEWRSLIADLCKVASPEFKNQLKSGLIEGGDIPRPLDAPFEQITGAAAFAEILPTLGHSNYRLLPADQRSFLVSFVSHTALIVLIASGIFLNTKPDAKHADIISQLTYAPLPGNGGGGSGDRSPIAVSKGTPPKMTEQQLAPPVVVVHRSTPLLPVQPTVVGPPDLKLPQSNRIAEHRTRQFRIDEGHQRQPTFTRGGSQEFHTTLDEHTDVELDVFKVDLAGFYFREIEYVVDNRKQ